jgi:hypothetical protein
MIPIVIVPLVTVGRESRMHYTDSREREQPSNIPEPSVKLDNLEENDVREVH